MTLPQTEGKRYQLVKEGEDILIVELPRRDVATVGSVVARCYHHTRASLIVTLLNAKDLP